MGNFQSSITVYCTGPVLDSTKHYRAGYVNCTIATFQSNYLLW